ncbi:MAG: hypothetical protein HPY62_11260, partial [Bacteroidales bacterium]|nr:hypothetical protein [Bacteroidales bacterium]
MKLRIWWQWVNSKPFYLRCFVFFLLIRPVAEQFYSLKSISPLFSPLYWLGALTLLFSVIGIINGKRIKSKLDRTFIFWAVLVVVSTTALYFSSSTILEYLNYATKLTIPVAVYYFLRVFIKDKVDFTGLLTTFLLSCIFPVGSILFGLIRGGYFAEGRFEGSYADVFNHAFYLSFGTITLLYHYVKSRSDNNSMKISSLLIVAGLVIAIAGLWIIKHIATIAVFITVIVLFIYIVFRKKQQAALLMIVLALLFIFFTGDLFYQEVVNPRIEYEVEIIEGSRDVDQAVHGRMSRWTWLMGDFRSAPFMAKLAGYPLSLKRSTHMINITPHNDFLRIMFFTGYAGLIFYIYFLYKGLKRVKYSDAPERFFIYAVIFSTILYSVTTVPTFYPGYVNILMIAFAYSALPVLRPVRNATAKNYHNR